MKKITLLVLLTLWGVLLSAQTISKGPYLIYPLVNTQMDVLWQMSAPATCTLSWGTDETYSLGSTQETLDNPETHQHKYTITGLTPGTLYYYEVSYGSTKLTGRFRAAPADDAEKVSIYAWGDTRDDQFDPNTINTQICSEFIKNPEYQTLIIHAGDWVNKDQDENWANEFFNRTSAAGNLMMHASLPQMGARGNHEGAAIYYKKYFPYKYQPGGCYYSFDYGPLHIAVVDQYVDYAWGSDQYVWLENDLASSSKKFKIILLHEPGWSAAGAHSDEIPVRTYIQPLCLEYHVSMVIGGHNHFYARGVVDNIVHLTLGGGGASSKTPSAKENIITYVGGLSYMRFDIDGNTLNAYAMNPNGNILDTYTLINSTTGVVENVEKQVDVRIVPNPTTGQFDFYSNQDLRGADFEIFNSGGQLIKKVHNTMDIKKTTLDISGQSDGMYYLRTNIGGVPISSNLLLMQK
jgi:hypothetical protein